MEKIIFKDLHSHLLPGVDNGTNTIDETIKYLKEISNEGVKEIVLTPHYIDKGKYSCNNIDKRKTFEELKQQVEKENIKIKLYLGNEVDITENFIKLITDRKIETINNTRYLLISYPIGNIPSNAKEILYELVTIGCIPIITHPEKHKEFQKNINLAEEYVNMGIILLGDYESLLGYNGFKSKITLKRLLKRNLITLLGSNTHGNKPYMLDEVYKKTKKIVKDDSIVEELFYKNFDLIIKDKKIKKDINNDYL